MISDQSTPLSLAQLFDTVPDAVAYYKVVRDKQNRIIDFVIEYANTKAQQNAADNDQPVIGRSFRSDNQHNSLLFVSTFPELCSIVETGQAREFDDFNPGLNRWQHVSQTKAAAGVLSIAHIIPAPDKHSIDFQGKSDQRSHQKDLLRRILDTSLNNVFVYEAIRETTTDGQPGPILDFSILLVNEQGRSDSMALMGSDPMGSTLLQINPDSRQTGQFNLYCQAIETGQPIQAEQYYPGTQVWYQTLITKHNDGCIVTGINITRQKQADLTNKQQTRLLNGVLNSSANGILALETIRDTAGIIKDFSFLAVNEAACKLLDKSPDELIGRQLVAIYPGTSELGILAKCIATVETDEPFTLEIQYQLDGLNSWYEVLGRKFGTGVVLTFRDVQHIKKLQAAIEQQAIENQQQAELLNSVLDSSASGVMAFRALRNAADNDIIDFQFMVANQASTTLVGRTIEEMIDHSLLSLFPGNVESGLFDLYKQTTETGKPGQTEIYYNHDGLDFWLDISSQKLGDGFVVTFTDISVVKRAAQAVEQAARATAQQAEFLNAVLDNSQTAISLHEAIRDPQSGQIVNFRTLLANNQAKTMWGALAGPIMTLPFLEVASPEQIAFDLPKYIHVVETGESDLTEFDIDGQRVLRLTAKSGDGVVISNIDITEIYRLRQQLEASVVDLKRSNANLEQFAYVASHDLQEPLRKIRAFGDIIQTQYAPVMGEQGTDLVLRMQAAAARMQILIKDVLAYSRITARHDNLNMVNLDEVVYDVVENLETIISDKEAILTIAPLPIILGDAPQLRQLFQNLLSNALKFAKKSPAPRIVLTCRLVNGCDAGLSVLPTDMNRLFHLLELQDNGIGFEPHHAERIFQIFQRLHGRSHFDGTGIGLAIVQKVVENHQGYIEATGIPGEGARFHILLPVIR